MKRKNFNFLSRTIMGLAVGAAAWTFSGFTADKAETVVCFSYNTTAPDNPGSGDATTTLNYSAVLSSCGTQQRTLCGICFDTDQFPLDPNGLPDFANNPALASLVANNRSATGQDGNPIEDEDGNWVILHFRPFSDQ